METKIEQSCWKLVIGHLSHTTKASDCTAVTPTPSTEFHNPAVNGRRLSAANEFHNVTVFCKTKYTKETTVETMFTNNPDDPSKYLTKNQKSNNKASAMN